MIYLLNIETSTNVCSVALTENEKLLSLKEDKGNRNHSTLITILIQEIIKEHDLYFKNIDAVAVSKGPGSYTGLRIGVSTAKGLCYALSRPLIGVNTLQAMAHSMSKNFSNYFSQDLDSEKLLFCPMIDAKRMEVYNAFYDIRNKAVRDTAADIINENSFKDILENYVVIFFGDGSKKCKPLLSKYSNALFVDDIYPSASAIGFLALQAFNKKCFEEIAYFEPFYLKEFVTTQPKKQ